MKGSYESRKKNKRVPYSSVRIVNKTIKLFLISIILLLLCAMPLFSQTSGRFEFTDQEIRDIVYVLSLQSSVPVVCDDTVSGKGSFLYASGGGAQDFERVFDAFLVTNRLTVIKEENLWTVTRIKIETDDKDRVSITAYDSSPAMILEKLSVRTGKTITYETLPSQRISVQIKDREAGQCVRLLLESYSEYEVQENDEGIRITRKKTAGTAAYTKTTDEEKKCEISLFGRLYQAEIKNASASEVTGRLFSLSGESYSFFISGDEKIRSLSFTDRTFEQAVNLVLEQVNAEAVKEDGVWYILPARSAVGKEAVKNRGREWHRLEITDRNTAAILPSLISKAEGTVLSRITDLLYMLYADESEFEKISGAVRQADGRNVTGVITLKYIKPAELLENLPPGFTKDEIYDTGNGNTVFFTGSAERQEKLYGMLDQIDRPKKLIRYDLLILQYEKSSSLSWGTSTSVRPSAMGDRTVISGEIGNLLGINFDAITAFGLTFSEKINTAISENRAAVYADTTLYGLSGEKISFKNTNTYRYRDTAVDPSTGKETFGTVTREITSGLVIQIDGWVSGDGMITMEINASVSKQGVDVSARNSNPPPTSEKNISTRIRARSGESVVLSGLSQSDSSEASQGVPLFSKIPVLGNLFKGKDKSETKTEMIIYLLPHVEEEETENKGGGWKEKIIQAVKAAREKSALIKEGEGGRDE